MEKSRVVVTKAGVSRFDEKKCSIFVGGDRSNASFSASAASYLRPPPHHQHMINGQQQDHHLGGVGGGGSTVVNGRSSTELSIFDAHKYFNESCVNNDAQKNVVVCGDYDDQCDDVSTVVPSRSSWASSSVVDHDYNSIRRNVYRARSFHVAASVTPTASSEASWNSQTGLLSNPPGTIAVSLRSPTHLIPHHHNQYQKKIKTREHQTTPSTSKTTLFRFPRRCPCSGNKSVQVEEGQIQISSQPTNMEMNKKETSSLSSSSPFSLQLLALPPRDWCQGRQVTINTIAPSVAAVKEPSKLPMGLPFNKDQVHTTTTTTSSGFSFPILKLNGGTTTSSSTMNSLHDDQPRNSLEVFGGQKPISTTDHHHNHHHFSTNSGSKFPTSPKSRRLSSSNINSNNNIEDDGDVASDTSSDLFEIESFSTSTTTTPPTQTPQSMLYQHCRRSRSNSLDDENMRVRLGANLVGMYSRPPPRSSLDRHQAATEYYYCYKTSEASVDWSVTTAEGLDRTPNTASEHDDDELEKTSRLRNCSGNNNYGLLSCKWEKAVSTVGPNPVKLIMPAAEGQDAVGPPPSPPPPPPPPGPPHNRHLSSQSSKMSSTKKHVESRPPLPKNNKLPRLLR